jgi:hypothetical protein
VCALLISSRFTAVLRSMLILLAVTDPYVTLHGNIVNFYFKHAIHKILLSWLPHRVVRVVKAVAVFDISQ